LVISLHISDLEGSYHGDGLVEEILVNIGIIVVVLFVVLLFYGLIMQVYDVIRARRKDSGEDGLP
jgi:hypothetical protein